MKTISLKTHIGTDGILRLALPVDVVAQDVEIVVVMQPAGVEVEAEAVDAMGYPPGFFEETYGSMADDPIERGSQGTPEVLDSLIR